MGLDPFSRHRVWNFLRERKADRVILLSTNLMDEADMLAGNCHFYLSLTMKNLGDMDSQGKIAALVPSVCLYCTGIPGMTAI